MVVFVAAPAKHGAVVHHRHRVIAARTDGFDVDQVGWHFCLRETVAAPAHGCAVGFDGERMVAASADRGDFAECRWDGDLADVVFAIPFDRIVLLDNQRVVGAAGNRFDPGEFGGDVALATEVIAPADHGAVRFEGEPVGIPCGNRCHVLRRTGRHGDLAAGICSPAKDPTAFECQRKVRPDGNVRNTAATTGGDVGLELFVHAPGHQCAVLEQTEHKRTTHGCFLDEQRDRRRRRGAGGRRGEGRSRVRDGERIGNIGGSIINGAV